MYGCLRRLDRSNEGTWRSSLMRATEVLVVDDAVARSRKRFSMLVTRLIELDLTTGSLIANHEALSNSGRPFHCAAR